MLKSSLLALIIALSLAACGRNPASAPASQPEAEPADTVVPEPTEEGVSTDLYDEGVVLYAPAGFVIDLPPGWVGLDTALLRDPSRAAQAVDLVEAFRPFASVLNPHDVFVAIKIVEEGEWRTGRSIYLKVTSTPPPPSSSTISLAEYWLETARETASQRGGAAEDVVLTSSPAVRISFIDYTTEEMWAMEQWWFTTASNRSMIVEFRFPLEDYDSSVHEEVVSSIRY